MTTQVWMPRLPFHGPIHWAAIVTLGTQRDLGGQPGQLSSDSSAQVLHLPLFNANHAINKLIETDFKMPASQFVALLPQPLGLAPRTSQRRAAFCNCGPAARAPDVGLVCLPRRELDGWIL